MDDLISRQALRDAMYHEAFETDSDMQKWDSGCWIRYKMFENVVEALPSAQPKEFEWCHDCKEYDVERHCCHRWTKVIRKTVEEIRETQSDRMKLVQEAVNTLMSTSKTNSIKDKCFRNAARFVQNAIDGEPQDFELIPDEPEQKTGKWIELYHNNYKCSVCGDWWANNDNEMVKDFKFCPNCGAKMEREQKHLGNKSDLVILDEVKYE